MSIETHPIVRFGESPDGKEQWFETANGDREKCGENFINRLWERWVSAEGSRRADTEEYNVFEFKV